MAARGLGWSREAHRVGLGASPTSELRGYAVGAAMGGGLGEGPGRSLRQCGRAATRTGPTSSDPALWPRLGAIGRRRHSATRWCDWVPADSNQAVPPGRARSLGPARHPEPPVRVREVELHGLGREPEHLGNLSVRPLFCDEREDLPLTRGEAGLGASPARIGARSSASAMASPINRDRPDFGTNPAAPEASTTATHSARQSRKVRRPRARGPHGRARPMHSRPPIGSESGSSGSIKNKSGWVFRATSAPAPWRPRSWRW